MASRDSFQSFSISRRHNARKMFLLGLFIVLITSNLIYDSCAVSWSSTVAANSSSWQIYRHSDNISFDYSSSVEGKIEPVDFHGKALPGYYAYYAEAGMNDVKLRQRTSALAGSYKSQDEIKMESQVLSTEIDVLVTKPIGSNIFTITYNTEQWPVILTTNRSMEYSGQQINDRDFEGNNGDYVGASFLYNHELSKDQRSVMWLQRLNATVYATNDSLISAELRPVKYSGYVIRASSTGIADLSYMQRDSKYDIKHEIYPALSSGEERYYGAYNLYRKIEMRSIFEQSNDTDDTDSWLPCCSGGWSDMTNYDKKSFGSSLSNIFDCKCYSVNVEP